MLSRQSEPPASAVRRLAPEAKLLAVVAFALLVVLTPARAWPALALDAVALSIVWKLARLPLGYLRRLSVELPFVAFALALPLVATGERVQIGPLSLSEPGLVGAGLLLCRATLGVWAAVILASTTPAHELVDGLQRLHLPAGLVEILSHMVRFMGVVADDLRRMTIARESRGGGLGVRGRLRAHAAGASQLFVRSYERGERVHLAMAARGYQGALPRYGSAPAASATTWWLVSALPASAVAALILGMVIG